MATNTYVALASETLISAVPTITFDNINQDYTDLVIVGNGIASTDAGIDVQFNNDGGVGSLYSFTYLYGDGTSAISGRVPNTTVASGGRLGVNGSVATLNVMNYSNNTTYKTMIARGSNAGVITIATAALWRNTNAITRIDLKRGGGGDFSIGSTFSLYGISAIGGVTPKATGGTVTSDETYWYHTFEMSGNFVPNQTLSCDYLVVAGGGGGGTLNGGGGGAGGLRSTVTATGGGGSLESALSLTAGSYPVTVGGGGAGAGFAAPTTGSNGSNSIFSTITSTGGGGGAGGALNGSSGGSGGGAGNENPGPNTGGAGTANQGYAGGNTNNNGAPFASAGGGGAGAVGGSVAGSVSAGNGGAGVATIISGTSITYAGGGGGGANGGTTSTGGSGGGGAGGVDVRGTDGTGNRGGGGGGSAQFNAGGNGGSGIVIVRYAK